MGAAPPRALKPGHLRQRRPGVWEVIVNGPRNPITGKRKPISRTVHGDWDAADKERDQVLAEIRAGKHGTAEATLADVLELWLPSLDEHSPTTRREYRRLAKNLIGPSVTGQLPLRKLTPVALTLFYKALRKSGRAANTVRNVHAVIRSALDYAVLAGWLDENPALKAKRPRTGIDKGAGRRRAPTQDAIGALLEAAANNREFAAFLAMAVASRARRGEVCALRRSDIDLDARTVHIHQAVVHDDADRLVLKSTKTHADRIRTIGPKAAAALSAHLAAMDERARAAGVRISKHGFVFSSRMDCSRPWDPDTATSYFVALRNGIIRNKPDLLRAHPILRTLRLHDLRHGGITWELDAGIPAPTVAEGAGHVNANVTLGVYAHGTAASSELAADVGDDLF